MSDLAAKTGFVSQLWHSFLARSVSNVLAELELTLADLHVAILGSGSNNRCQASGRSLEIELRVLANTLRV